MRMRALAARFTGNASCSNRVGKQALHSDVAITVGAITNLVTVQALPRPCRQLQFRSMALGQRAVDRAQFIGDGFLAQVMHFARYAALFRPCLGKRDAHGNTHILFEPIKGTPDQGEIFFRQSGHFPLHHPLIACERLAKQRISEIGYPQKQYVPAQLCGS